MDCTSTSVQAERQLESKSASSTSTLERRTVNGNQLPWPLRFRETPAGCAAIQ